MLSSPTEGPTWRGAMGALAGMSTGHILGLWPEFAGALRARAREIDYYNYRGFPSLHSGFTTKEYPAMIQSRPALTPPGAWTRVDQPASMENVHVPARTVWQPPSRFKSMMSVIKQPNFGNAAIRLGFRGAGIGAALGLSPSIYRGIRNYFDS